MKDFKSILGGKKSKDIDPKDKASVDIPQDNKDPANLTIHSIFTKDASYEAPETPRVFPLPWDPQVKFDIQVMRRSMEKPEGLHEVVLHTTISTTLEKPKGKDDKGGKDETLTAFVIDLKMAGMFTIKGLADDQLDRVLSTTAPTILFPYAAEAVSAMVTKGGFPQFILPPIDFATLYKQRLAEQAKK
jgi:preprotein translocase subunit SecB